jgi:hypothetical protein
MLPSGAGCLKEAALRINLRLAAIVTAAGALAIAVPAAAHPVPSDHPTGAGHTSQSHRCQAHNVAYIESGTVDAVTPSTLAKNPDGTWSGTLVVDVARTNHWAKANEGQTVSYTFTNATLEVRLDDGSSGFAAGEQVRLIGKLAAVAKKCSALSPAATPVFRMVVVHPAAS